MIDRYTYIYIRFGLSCTRGRAILREFIRMGNHAHVLINVPDINVPKIVRKNLKKLRRAFPGFRKEIVEKRGGGIGAILEKLTRMVRGEKRSLESVSRIILIFAKKL